MIGKLIGAFAGERIAQRTSGVSGPMGAVIGAGTAAAVRRMGPFGLLAALAGGFAMKRYLDRREGPAAPAHGTKATSRPKAKK